MVLKRNFSSSLGSNFLTNKNLWKNSGYIHGEFVSSSSDHFTVTNPANSSILGSLPRMDANDVNRAAESNNEAWKTWKMTTAKERSKIISKMAQLMESNRKDLATIVTLEAGKPFAEANGEIGASIANMEFYAEEATRINGEVLQPPVKGRRVLAIKQPVGPAALITPWNFPSAMITRKVAPALAAGCTVTIKPSEETPYSALALCAIAEEAGVPKGVINCLTVGRDEVGQVGTALCHNELFRKISFTGSTAVGKWLLRESANTVKRASMELGGNAPFIVFDDADLDVALNALLFSKFRNAGQTCICSNRVLVQENVYDRFAEMLAEKVSKMKCGNGLESGVTVGPLINMKGLDKVHNQVSNCLYQGAKAITGGSPHVQLNAQGGSFYLPTVLTGVTNNMLPFQEETFGPLAPLMSFKTEEEALTIANSTRHGLAGYACTRDLARAFRVSEGLEFGMVGVNEGAITSESAPFGGVKESGLGRESGSYGLEEYLEVKYICMGLGK